MGPDLWVLVFCVALRHNLQDSCLAAGARFVRVPNGLLGPAGRYLQESTVTHTLLCTPGCRLGQSPFGTAVSRALTQVEANAGLCYPGFGFTLEPCSGFGQA